MAIASFIIYIYTTFPVCIDLENMMKFTGILLLLAGWGITLSAIVLLPHAGARSAFMLTGMLVELLGLALVARAHLQQAGR